MRCGCQGDALNPWSEAVFAPGGAAWGGATSALFEGAEAWPMKNCYLVTHPTTCVFNEN